MFHKIYGCNKYQGSVEKEFIIVDKAITKAKIKGMVNFEYDGTEKEQDAEAITVMLGSEMVPTEYCEL